MYKYIYNANAMVYCSRYKHREVINFYNKQTVLLLTDTVPTYIDISLIFLEVKFLYKYVLSNPISIFRQSY